jgi:hypothetical protein
MALVWLNRRAKRLAASGFSLHCLRQHKEKRSMEAPSNRPLSRREALKALAGITGAAALSSLPGKWTSPVVNVGALPAHAQGSPVEFKPRPTP